MWQQKTDSRQKTVVGSTVDSHLAVVVGHVLYEPVDRVVGIACFVRGFRIARTGRSLHRKFALGPESSSDVLYHEDIAISGELFVRNRYLARCPQHVIR